MREREIIRKYFNYAAAASIKVGIGDDAAVVANAKNRKLAISTDTLVAGVHFRADDRPFFLARKAAAVSLSDMAAMGARPLWMTVSITFGGGNNAAKWFAAIGKGFADSAREYDYNIIGGDLTRGKQTQITTTAIGSLSGKPLIRGGAKPGDDIWLSGTVGEAALALQMPQVANANCKTRLHNPSPRLQLGMALVGVASAAVDLSDGLACGLCDIAQSSGARLVADSDMLPLSAALCKVGAARRLRLMLDGGDDYELLFCAAASKRKVISKNFGGVSVVRIGVVGKGRGAYLQTGDKQESLSGRGYEHNFNK